MVHHIKHAKHSGIKLDVKKALPLMNAVELIKLTIMLQQWLACHWIIAMLTIACQWLAWHATLKELLDLC